MAMVVAYKRVVLERYAQFSGRAGRAEFWWYVLANLIIQFVLQLLASATDLFTILLVIYALGVLIPGLAVAIRRLHDTGKSGWFLLIGLIPLIGFIVLLVFYISEGDSSPNEYGAPDPLPAA